MESKHFHCKEFGSKKTAEQVGHASKNITKLHIELKIRSNNMRIISSADRSSRTSLIFVLNHEVKGSQYIQMRKIFLQGTCMSAGIHVSVCLCYLIYLCSWICTKCNKFKLSSTCKWKCLTHATATRQSSHILLIVQIVEFRMICNF